MNEVEWNTAVKKPNQKAHGVWIKKQTNLEQNKGWN